jgi:hypothetical protein
MSAALSPVQVEALVMAVTSFEATVAGNIEWVFGRQVKQCEEHHPGFLADAYARAVTRYEGLLVARAMAGPFARDTYDSGPMNIASAWSDLEVFFRRQGNLEDAAACCARYEQERAAVPVDSVHYLDHYRAEVFAEAGLPDTSASKPADTAIRPSAADTV